MTNTASFKQIWQLSLFSFIVAAISGFLYRYGMLYSLPEWLHFANIRHAHSHLMFFNWICAPIMVWMAASITGCTSEKLIRKFTTCLYSMLFLGFLSFPLFLVYGYHSVAIGTANLPLAAIVSGLVMLNWYWFARLYYSNRKGAPSTLSMSFFDGALLALIISSLGAWGVSVFQFTNVDSPLTASAMTHFFLTVFTEGWAVLGILGIIWSQIQDKESLITITPGWLWIPILFGSMMVFPFSLTQTMITPLMLSAAKAGLVLIVLSLSLNVWLLIKSKELNGFLWKSVIALLILKILLQSLAILPVDIWPGEHGLRVLYLHMLLLGFVSITLFESFHPSRNWFAKVLFTTSVFLVVISLINISGYWPARFIIPNIYFWIMIIAILPIIPATHIWISDLLN